MIRKVMVISLGTGRDVEYGIAKSIRAHNPGLVVFIVTKESFQTIEKVETILDTTLEKQHLVLEDKDDIEDCYRTAREVLQWLRTKGYSPNEIVVDFTSGTKAMSVGVALGAIADECEALSYVAGKRNAATGRVITGTERVVSLTPLEIFAENRRKFAATMFNSYQFDACLEVTQSIRACTQDEKILNGFLLLEKLASAYSAWDKFDHRNAKECLKQLTKEELAKLKLDLSKNKEFIGKLISAKERYHPRYIADLLNNAKRRAQEGKYDDAVARLYRVIELIAQRQLLNNFAIDSSNVKIENVPERLKAKYVMKKAIGNEKTKAGLFESYELLTEFEDLLGVKFADSNELHDKLGRRNDSILAHGLKPVDKNTFDILWKYAQSLALIAIEDLETLEKAAKFPTIDLW